MTASVEQVAEAIDAAERTLTAARDQQVSSLQQLYHEEAQLEADIEAIGTRIDTEIAAEVERAATTSARKATTTATGCSGSTRQGPGPTRSASAGPR